MLVRKRWFLPSLIAMILLCGGLFYLYVSQIESCGGREFVRPQVEVVKAARNIPAGTPLTKDRITTEMVPERFLPPNPLLIEDLNIYLGIPFAVNVEEGAMVLASDFSVHELEANAEYIKVVVFDRKVLAGEVLRASDVTEKTVPIPPALREFPTKSPEYPDLVGKRLLVDKKKGDLLLQTEVSGKDKCEVAKPDVQEETIW